MPVRDGVNLKKIKKRLKQSDLPHPDLLNEEKRKSKQNDQRVHILLTLALELMLKKQRSLKYYSGETFSNYLVFHKYCIYLAIASAEFLSLNMQAKFTSHDPHHEDSYARICSILNERFTILPDTPRKSPEARVKFSDVMLKRYESNSLDSQIYHYDFGRKHYSININQGRTRTYYLYASVFGFCALRLLAQRVAYAFQQMSWFASVTKLHELADVFLPHITCALLGLELMFELAIVIRAVFRGKPACNKLLKDNRPWRLVYAIVTLALILCNPLTPICSLILFSGFDLLHSLCMAVNQYMIYKRLQVQLVENTVPECKNYPDRLLMPAGIRIEFLTALNWKMTCQVFKILATFVCLLTLCAGVFVLGSNPFAATICLLVGAACAFINRMHMIMKMSDTPGVPKSLEKRCESHADPKKNPALPTQKQCKRMNGKEYTSIIEQVEPRLGRSQSFSAP